MHPLTAPFLAAAGLLAAAGVLKLLTPAGTVRALRTQGLPASPMLVRLLGSAEVLVAVLAALGLPAGAALTAAAYAGFTWFVALALVRRRPLSSCGCFGDPDLPPTVAHVVVTALFAGVAGAVVAGAPAGLPALAEQGGGLAAVTAAAALLVGWLAYLVLAELPRVAALASPPQPESAGPAVFSITSRSAVS